MIGPKVSICVVCYNQKDFLEECIISIIEQDYKNIEIIVCDDASIDGSQKVLLALKDRFPRLMLHLNETNMGITENSNIGFRSCTGDYLCYIGGDDVMLPNKISIQVDFMESNKEYNICYHDIVLFQAVTGKTINFFSRLQKVRVGDASTQIKYGIFNGAISNMVRKSACPPQGFNSRVPIASDWLFFCECLLPNGKLGYIDKVLVKQRIGFNNVTSTSAENLFRRKIALEDHLVSCSILLFHYPAYASEIKFRMASLLREYRLLDKKRLNKYLLASIIFKLTFKSFAGLMLNLLKIKYHGDAR
jgi:glycosyltransferase involved in cell wall biosynthesis